MNIHSMALFISSVCMFLTGASSASIEEHALHLQKSSFQTSNFPEYKAITDAKYTVDDDPPPAGVENHFGVGFSTQLMTNPPTNETVLNQILPELKDTLGISKFRIYNAIADKHYVADLIENNKDVELLVDVGFIWYRETEQITIDKLSPMEVARYLTDFIDEVGEAVKEANGKDYEWLDNVRVVAYINEPYIEYNNHDYWKPLFDSLGAVATGMNKINTMVQDFFNNYEDGKYKTNITVAPIFYGNFHWGFTDVMLEKSIALQATAGAPTGLYVNVYACHPGGYGSGHVLQPEELDRCLECMLEKNLMTWNDKISQLEIPVASSEVKLTISETGWPTSGWEYANETIAAKFYSNLIPQMNDTNNGLYGKDIYFFEALDENEKGGGFGTEPHWGLMYGNGTVKAEIAESWPWPNMVNGFNGSATCTETKSGSIVHATHYLVITICSAGFAFSFMLW